MATVHNIIINDQHFVWIEFTLPIKFYELHLFPYSPCQTDLEVRNWAQSPLLFCLPWPLFLAWNSSHPSNLLSTVTHSLPCALAPSFVRSLQKAFLHEIHEFQRLDRWFAAHQTEIFPCCITVFYTFWRYFYRNHCAKSSFVFVNAPSTSTPFPLLCLIPRILIGNVLNNAK